MSNLVESGDSVGLSDHEREHCSEIMVSLVQGVCSPEQFKYLERYSRRDPTGFISSQLNAIMRHPEFMSRESIVDNFHKNAMIRIKLEDTKNKSRLQTAQGQQITMNMINKMLAMNKPRDGEKFGVVGSEVVDADDKPVEYTDGPVRLPDDDESKQ